ncbi:hypothetical protein ACO0LG_09130 [Undibacterium sp. Ji42W]|uniref:hypothetical protein n=1 Tax=Undibacterium sp. Ji42W TaxID=3413039 RepID=UPI003BF36A64
MRHISSSFSLAIAGKYIVAFTVACILSACVTLRPVLPRGERPDTNTGYVAGVFQIQGKDDFAFGITNVNGGEELIFPFANPAGPQLDKKSGREVPDRVTMIQLPPGRYRLTSWVAYGPGTKQQTARKNLPADNQNREFVVTAGRVSFLGKFTATYWFGGLSKNFHIIPQRITENELASMLKVAYPFFSMDIIDPRPGSLQ